MVAEPELKEVTLAFHSRHRLPRPAQSAMKQVLLAIEPVNHMESFTEIERNGEFNDFIYSITVFVDAERETDVRGFFAGMWLCLLQYFKLANEEIA